MGENYKTGRLFVFDPTNAYSQSIVMSPYPASSREYGAALAGDGSLLWVSEPGYGGVGRLYDRTTNPWTVVLEKNEGYGFGASAALKWPVLAVAASNIPGGGVMFISLLPKPPPTETPTPTPTLTPTPTPPITGTVVVNTALVKEIGGSQIITSTIKLDGSPITSGDPIEVNPGNHQVYGESNWAQTQFIFSVDCDENGVIAVMAGETKTCHVLIVPPEFIFLPLVRK